MRADDREWWLTLGTGFILGVAGTFAVLAALHEYLTGIS